MPYVKQKQRKELKNRDPLNEGELNYNLTMVIIKELKLRGINYQVCNSIMGALERIKDFINSGKRVNSINMSIQIHGFSKLAARMYDAITKPGTYHTSREDLLGVVRCASDEFYRRVVVKLEDRKIKENGDVY